MPDPSCPWCQTPLDDHLATKCLDMWLLEAVLGYERLEGDAIPVEVSRRDGPGPHLQRVWRKGRGWYCEECGSIPNFCEEIEAAWQVVEHFSEGADGHGGYNVQLDGHGGGWWTFHIFKDGTCYEATAPTVELAIVKAALLACQEEGG